MKENLKRMRLEKGFTQKNMCDLLNVSHNCYASYEQGRTEPNIEMLVKISEIFNCSIDYLVGREDDFGNVVVSAPNGNVSPADEKLLKDFYALGPFEQEYIRGQIQALLNTSREVIKK